MIEAVNSSLASAQLLRGNVEQAAASRAVSAAPISAGNAPEAPKAPYVSPYITFVDSKAVIQIRDGDTGDVQDQYPSKSRLAQLSRDQARQAAVADVKDVSQSQPKETKVSTPQSTSIITVQDVTSAAPSNISQPSPQVAAAALSAGAQSAQPSSSAGVTLFA